MARRVENFRFISVPLSGAVDRAGDKIVAAGTIFEEIASGCIAVLLIVVMVVTIVIVIVIEVPAARMEHDVSSAQLLLQRSGV